MTANGYEISLWGDENVLKLESGDGGPILQLYQKPLDVQFKRLNFTVCELEFNKIIFKKK